MLSLMRKHSGSWIIKILLGAIALSFALFWGVSSYDAKPETIAKVNGEVITAAQLDRAYKQLVEQYRQQFGEQFSIYAPLLNLRQMALNQLVDQTLLMQAAQEMNITVSPEELRDRLASIPAFSSNGQFDIALYRRYVATQELSPELFEVLFTEQLAREKLFALITSACSVTPLELNKALEDNLLKVEGAYVLFNPDDYKGGLEVSDEEISKQYEEARNAYLTPAKVVFSYIAFPWRDYRDLVQVAEEDIEDAYETERNRYQTPEAVQVRYIFLPVAENASPEESAGIKKQAEEILAEARQPETDFNGLGKKYAPDQSSTVSEPFWSPRGQLYAVLEDGIFAMKPGEYNLFETPMGLYVINLLDYRPASVTPLEEVHSRIVEQLTEAQAQRLADAEAEKASAMLYAGQTLAAVAQEYKRSLRQAPETQADDDVPGLPGLRNVWQSLASVEPGQGVVLPYADGMILAVVDQHIQPQLIPLEEVKEDIRAVVLAQKARAAALDKASELLTQLAGESDPQAAILAKDGVKRTGLLGHEEEVEGLIPSQALMQALFLRPLSRPVLKEPAPVGSGQVAAAVLLERKLPTEEEKQEISAEVEQSMLIQKQNNVVQMFVTDLRAKADLQVSANLQ